MARNGTGGLEELAHALRQLREAAGPGDRMTLAQAAERAGKGFSAAKISRIERGMHIPAPDDVSTLLEVYGAPDSTRQELRRLAETVKASRKRIVISRHPGARAEFQARMAELAASSRRVVEFNPIIVPGLLQTPEYMRAVWASNPHGTPAEGARFMANRLAGQAVLDDPDKHVLVLLTEGALGWAAGSAQLMADQVDHIVSVARHSRARVGIIPFGTVAPEFPVSSWTLYDQIAAVPGVLAHQVVLNPPDTGAYVAQLARLEPLAVYGHDAWALLERTAGRYRAL